MLKNHFVKENYNIKIVLFYELRELAISYLTKSIEINFSIIVLNIT